MTIYVSDCKRIAHFPLIQTQQKQLSFTDFVVSQNYLTASIGGSCETREIFRGISCDALKDFRESG